MRTHNGFRILRKGNLQVVFSSVALHTMNLRFSYSHTFSNSSQDFRVETNAQIEQSDISLLGSPVLSVAFLRNADASEKSFLSTPRLRLILCFILR